MGALVDDNSPGITERSGAIKNVAARVKNAAEDDENVLKPNCRAKHCATTLGCATENEY